MNATWFQSEPQPHLWVSPEWLARQIDKLANEWESKPTQLINAGELTVEADPEVVPTLPEEMSMPTDTPGSSASWGNLPLPETDTAASRPAPGEVVTKIMPLWMIEEEDARHQAACREIAWIKHNRWF